MRTNSSSLLSRVVRGRLVEEIPIHSEVVRHDLTIACLELLHITPRAGVTLPQADEWLTHIERQLKRLGLTNEKDLDLIGNTPSRACMYAVSKLANRDDRHPQSNQPDWIRSLCNAFWHLCKAAEEIERLKDREAIRSINNLLDRIWVTAIEFLVSARDKSSYYRVMSVARGAPDAHVDSLLDYGLFPPTVLAYAIAANFALHVPNGPPGADALADEAFRLWDTASAKARNARGETWFADILAAACECCLLYSTTEVLLRWAIARRMEGGQASDELQKEHQVVEELRVLTHETLVWLGDDFVWKPAALAHHSYQQYLQGLLHDATELAVQGHSVAILGPSRSRQQQLLSAAIDDAVAINPLFPDVIANLWRELSVHVANRDVAPDGIDAHDVIREGVVARLPECFSDPLVVTSAQEIARKALAESDDLLVLQAEQGKWTVDRDPARRWLSRELRRETQEHSVRRSNPSRWQVMRQIVRRVASWR